jgi:hypothetical protein
VFVNAPGVAGVLVVAVAREGGGRTRRGRRRGGEEDVEGTEDVGEGQGAPTVAGGGWADGPRRIPVPRGRSGVADRSSGVAWHLGTAGAMEARTGARFSTEIQPDRRLACGSPEASRSVREAHRFNFVGCKTC